MKTAAKTHWFRNTLIVLIVCGLIGTVLSVIRFTQDPGKTSAKATLQLSFNGAAKGIGPNGNEYDINDVKTDEVLNSAIAKAGMEGSVTADQLKDNLVIKGIYPEDIAKSVLSYDSLLDFNANRSVAVTDYYPTTFELTLYSDFDPSVSEANLKGLIRNVTEAYREYFIKKYSVKWDNEKGQEGWETLDYTQQITVLSENLTQTARYVEELYTKEPAFKAEGIGFNDILARLESLNTNDLARLEANIVQNALTKQENRLLTQYRYQIDTWGNQVEKKQDELKMLDELVAKYEKSEIIYLSTAGALNQVGGTASATYDTLVKRQKDTSEKITELNNQIAKAKKRVEELVGTGAVTEEAAAEVIAAAEQATTEQTAEGTGTESTGPAAEGTAAETPVKEEETKEEEVTELTAEEKAELHDKQTATLQKRIDRVVTKRNEIIADLNKLLTAYNEQEMTDSTIALVSVGYSTPKLLSMSFVMRVLKTAGPFCAVGFMVCMILLIRSRRKEEKANEQAA